MPTLSMLLSLLSESLFSKDSLQAWSPSSPPAGAAAIRQLFTFITSPPSQAAAPPAYSLGGDTHSQEATFKAVETTGASTGKSLSCGAKRFPETRSKTHWINIISFIIPPPQAPSRPLKETAAPPPALPLAPRSLTPEFNDFGCFQELKTSELSGGGGPVGFLSPTFSKDSGFVLQF